MKSIGYTLAGLAAIWAASRKNKGSSTVFFFETMKNNEIPHWFFVPKTRKNWQDQFGSFEPPKEGNETWFQRLLSPKLNYTMDILDHIKFLSYSAELMLKRTKKLHGKPIPIYSSDARLKDKTMDFIKNEIQKEMSEYINDLEQIRNTNYTKLVNTGQDRTDSIRNETLQVLQKKLMRLITIMGKWYPESKVELAKNTWPILNNHLATIGFYIPLWKEGIENSGNQGTDIEKLYDFIQTRYILIPTSDKDQHLRLKKIHWPAYFASQKDIIEEEDPIIDGHVEIWDK